MGVQRSVVVLIAGACLLLVAGIVVAVGAARQAEPAYPAHSPQATVATYLRLLQQGQVDRAFAMTTLFMDSAQYHEEFDAWSQSSHRATLVQSNTSNDSASVTVDISTFSAGAFGTSDQTTRVTFTLERANGTWLITGPEYVY